MGERLSTQLGTLDRERERLEELLMLDGNWRALRQLDEREAAGDPLETIDGADLRESLLAALRGNRIYAARAKLLETIELLASIPGDGEEHVIRTNGVMAGAPRLASRIVLLNQPGSDNFRARVRMKPAAGEEVTGAKLETAEVAAEPAASRTPPSSLPDALELIDGLGRHSVELLLSHGVMSFAEIARWTSADAALWGARLDGLAQGLPSAWIEQAAMLQAGRETYYAARVRRGEFAALADPPPPEPRRVQPIDEPPAPQRNGARLISAEELAATLARASTAETKPEIEPDLEPVEKAPPLSRLSLRRRAFTRPIVMSPIIAEASEVIVITRPAPAAKPRPAPVNGNAARLSRRLKGAVTDTGFSADGYAAYRSAVEEASVTIVGAPNAPPPRAAPQATEPPSSGPVTVNRFLKALTGRN